MSTATDQIDALKSAVIQEEATAQSAISTRDLLITDQKGQIAQLGDAKVAADNAASYAQIQAKASAQQAIGLQGKLDAATTTIADLNAKLALQPLPVIQSPTPIATVIQQGQTIQSAIDAGAKYIDVWASATPYAPFSLNGKTGVVITGMGPVVIDGQNKFDLLIDAAMGNVIRNITVQNALSVNPNGQGWAVIARSGSTLEQICAHDCSQGGIHCVGDNLIGRYLSAWSNGINGIGGGSGTGFVMSYLISFNNGLKNQHPGLEGGGGKWAAAKKLTIRNSRYYRNAGFGLWFDSSCDGVLVDGGVYAFNHWADPQKYFGCGIAVEISKNVIVQNILTYGNTGAGVQFSESQNFSLLNCDIYDYTDGRSMSGRQPLLNGIYTNVRYHGNAALGMPVDMKAAKISTGGGVTFEAQNPHPAAYVGTAKTPTAAGAIPWFKAA